MHDDATVRAALDLASNGTGAATIARELHVPRSTIRGWLKGAVPERVPRQLPAVEQLPPAEYSYLLGAYLGDGHIAAYPRTFQLRISLDSSYPAIVDEVRAAVQAVMPSNRVRPVRHREWRLVRVASYSKDWPHTCCLSTVPVRSTPDRSI